MAGPVTLLYVVGRRRDLKDLILVVRSIEPNGFYVTEHAGTVSKTRRPFMQQRTGGKGLRFPLLFSSANSLNVWRP